MTAPDAVDFETFVAARAAALSRTAYLLTGNHHDAEDLVQTTLFKAARSWHRLKGEPEPYVRRIMYNENVSRSRADGSQSSRPRRCPSSRLPTPTSTPSSSYDEHCRR